MPKSVIRVKRELKQLQRSLKRCEEPDEPKEVWGELKLDKDDCMKAVFILYGPKDSPYDGGHFQINIGFPEEYPFKPPKITFATKVWNPSFSEKGEFCLDMLDSQWTTGARVEMVLLALLDLLKKPSLYNCSNPEAAIQLKNDREEFEKKAKKWTKRYATKVKEEDLEPKELPVESIKQDEDTVPSI